MKNYNINATEIDPDKKYVFLMDYNIPAAELIAFRDAVQKAGFSGLVWRGTIKIIDYDKIVGYLEPPKE